MNDCGRIQKEFSGYLDGAIPGSAMQDIALHLKKCGTCSTEFEEWRQTQTLVSSLGSASTPEDLGLRLRLALSHEVSRTPHEQLGRWRVRWENSVRPLVLQASAGLASAILLIGTVSVLVGSFATAEPLSASDEPLGPSSDPHFLYSSFEPGTIGSRDNPIVVEAFVDGNGRVYDFKIVSGPTDTATRSQLVSSLLLTVFAPARTLGEPTPGTAVLSFSGVSVRG